MDVLSSRILLRPSDLDRSCCFYRERVSLRMVVLYKYAGLAAGRHCSRGLRSGCRRGGGFRLAARISALGAHSTDARIWQAPLSAAGCPP
jgi:hypothetical protein